jgi:DNA-binding MarR family transcriptional regulator
MAKTEQSNITDNNKPMKVDEDTRNLFVLLEQTRSAAVAALEVELNHYNTDFTEGRILYILSKSKNGMTQADISKYVIKKQNSISVQLTKMEKKGLVKKTKKPDDVRIYTILTPKGFRLWNKINELSIFLIFSSLSVQEKEQLGLSLSKLRDKARNLLNLDFKPPFLP